MEIMNYAEMIENSKVVNALANKTIECSKDYVDACKDDIIDQMMEYLALTVSDVFRSDIDLDYRFCEKANMGYGLSFSRFGGDGETARLQFFYNRHDMIIRVYFNEFGHWYSQKKISDEGLKHIIDVWDQYKTSWNKAIENGIKNINSFKASELKKQLELHEAVKNFEI